jgi:hypothetical protein
MERGIIGMKPISVQLKEGNGRMEDNLESLKKLESS